MEKLLFTGGTGFLGANAKPVLDTMYDVTTIGITEKDELKANFVTDVPELPSRYDIVLHAAGKAHVYPKTEAERRAFYDINLTGTINLCKAIEKAGCPRSFIFISTMSVYGSKPGENDNEESRELVGDTPYADSKIKAEQFLMNWARQNGVILTILRPALLAGKNAPGNLGAMVDGINKGRYLSIAHGAAKKSMLMAEDIARLVPLVADKGGIYNVCDSHHPTFGELEVLISNQLGKKAPISIPYWLAKCVAMIGDMLGEKFPINSARLEKITTSSTFSNEKARMELGWEPLDVLENYKI